MRSNSKLYLPVLSMTAHELAKMWKAELIVSADFLGNSSPPFPLLSGIST